jgi:hypothetical protein
MMAVFKATFYSLCIALIGAFLLLPTCYVATARDVIPNPSSDLAEKYNLKVHATQVLNDQWASLGPAQKTFSYVKRFTPFLSWSYLCTAFETRHTSFLLGSCLVAESDYLHDLPTSDFKVKYASALATLWARSELDAISFSEAMFGQSTQDILAKNLLSISQIVGLLVVIFLLLRHFGLKKTFVAAVVTFLGGGILLRLLMWSGASDSYFLYLHDLVEFGVGALAVLLGAALAARRIMTRSPSATGNEVP